MKKLLLLLLLIVIGAGVAGVVQKNKRSKSDEAGRAATATTVVVPVLLTNVSLMTVPVQMNTFGTVEPMTTVAVKSEITGILAKVRFSEGQDVEEGAILFEIDSRGSEAVLKQAEAVLAKDRVQWDNARKEAGRQEALLKKGISAQDVRDAAVTAAETLKAQVQSDEAAVDNARLQLSYCFIRSPVKGRTGNLLIHQGNLVKSDDATLVTINQIHPILVRFVIPQRDLFRVRKCVEQGGLSLVVTPQGTGVFAETGTVMFVDNAVDVNTGTIQLKARFENEAAVLWPGQFVKVVLQFARQENAVVVPESAVLVGQQGDYVYVVARDGRVVPRSVIVDRTVGGVSVIASGLVSGEEIVADGQLRLKPGALVKLRTATPAECIPAGRP